MTTPVSKNEAKIRQPQDFTGDRLKARKFFLDCGIYLNLNSHIYDTDEKKISFVLSFCSGGTAEAFAENYYTLGKHSTAKWADFEKDFRQAFLTSDLEGESLQQLKKLTQTGSADEYIAQFKILASRAKITQYEALKDYFLSGLTSGLRTRLFNLNSLPATMDDWYSHAQTLDNQYRQLNTYSSPAQSSNRQPFPRRNDFNRNRAPVVETSTRIRNLGLEDFLEQLADDVYAARLSTSDRERFFRDNLCFRCGKKGHIARNCSNAPLPPNNSTSLRPQNRSSPAKKSIRALHQDDTPDDDFEDLSIEDRTANIRALLSGITDDDYNQIVDSIQETESQDDAIFRED